MPGLSDLVGMASSIGAGAGAAEQAAGIQGALSFDPVKYKPAPVATGQEQFLAQGAALPDVATLLRNTNAADNAAYQARINAIDPSLAGSIGTLSKKASDYAAGVVAPDVQAKLSRDSAYQALQGGYGGSGQEGSSPFAENQQLVNLDKYRLNEQTNLAPELNQEAFKYSAALSPTNSDVAQTLLSPSALLQRQDSNDLYNNQIANQQAQLDAQAKAAKGNIFTGTNTSGGTSTGQGGLGGI